MSDRDQSVATYQYAVCHALKDYRPAVCHIAARRFYEGKTLESTIKYIRELTKDDTNG